MYYRSRRAPPSSFFTISFSCSVMLELYCTFNPSTFLFPLDTSSTAYKTGKLNINQNDLKSFKANPEKWILQFPDLKLNYNNSLSQPSGLGVGSGGSGASVGSGLSPRPGMGLGPRGGAGWGDAAWNTIRMMTHKIIGATELIPVIFPETQQLLCVIFLIQSAVSMQEVTVREVRFHRGRLSGAYKCLLQFQTVLTKCLLIFISTFICFEKTGIP